MTAAFIAGMFIGAAAGGLAHSTIVTNDDPWVFVAFIVQTWLAIGAAWLLAAMIFDPLLGVR